MNGASPAAPEQDRLFSRLLSRLAPDDYHRLQPHLEPVTLRKGEILAAPDVPVDHAYFPERGVGSVVALSAEGLRAESGLFGRDGLGPVPLVFGIDRSPHEITMQIAGGGFRIAAPALAEAMAERPALGDLFLRFAHSFAVQTSFTALSNAVHPLDERCARWILMCHDRTEGDDIPLTHEFLAVMLAVRRPSVTTALHVLEGNRLIRAERGWVTVIDRVALEEFAADAYGKPEAEYERLIGPLR